MLHLLTRVRIARPFVALAMSGLLLVFAGACHRTPDEQQVRAAIAIAARSARANDVDGVLAAVSGDFVGDDGALDRRGLKQMLALRAFRHDSTGVLIGPISVERRGDRLIAGFMLTLTGGGPDSLLPDQADAYEMATAWRKEAGGWRCYNATWRSVR
jgi:ketosteroid isomerase-like protein